MDHALHERHTRDRVATHLAARRPGRLAHENHPRFVERSLRNSAEAHGRSMAAQRWADTNHRGGRGGSGSIASIVGLLILGVVAYGLFAFVASSGLLP